MADAEKPEVSRQDIKIIKQMKKKFLFLFLVLFSTFTVYAQDVIVKNNAEEIEAKVVNISEKEITYYKWGNQDGPTYTISVSNVLFIKYANGQKEIFSTFIENNNEKSKSANNVSLISRSGQTYYYDGNTMKGSAYARFLKENCPEAYQQYTKGVNIATAGWCLLAVGGVFDMSSLIISRFGSQHDARIIANALGLVGGALELACIPTLAVGYHKMHGSADIYNMQCVNKQQPTTYWSINVDANGIGIALNF